MPKPKKKPWLAGLLSFFVVGMGQIYNKKYKKCFFLWVSLCIIGFFSVWFINYFSYLIVLVWFYAIYDAYKTAQKTIAKEPNKNAIWFTVIIYVVLFFVALAGFWYGFYSGYYGNYTYVSPEIRTEAQSKVNELEKTNNQFLSKLDEVGISLNAGDTTTARNRISETKLLLTEATQKLKSLCNWFSEKGLLSEFERGLGTPCSAFIDLYESCFPNLLNNYYILTYVYDNAKKLSNNQITSKEYISYCNSWLNDYNVVRGTCNTLFKKANMDTSLDDLSKICEIS
jgi:TM2 domain-containing membrane protein YozV